MKRTMNGNGANGDTMRRMLIWLSQALLGCFMFWLWSENKEIKSQLAAMASAQSVRAESFVRLESKTERYGQDIAEIKSSIQALSASFNEMRLSLEKRK